MLLPERRAVETGVPDIMDDTRGFHEGRLREAFEQIEVIREKNITALDGEFEMWKERVQQSLTALFGEDHRHTNSFRELAFWLVRAGCGEGIHWSRIDKKIWDTDLERAENILSDVLEERSKNRHAGS